MPPATSKMATLPSAYAASSRDAGILPFAISQSDYFWSRSILQSTSQLIGGLNLTTESKQLAQERLFVDRLPGSRHDQEGAIGSLVEGFRQGQNGQPRF